MNNLRVLYRYELKKILMRKIVYATLAICFIATVILLIGELIGPYYIGNEKVDTQYHMFLTDRNYQKMLDGKEIDQALLEETIAAYGMIPITAEKYSSTEEYQKYARPYSAIFNFVRDFAANTAKVWHTGQKFLQVSALQAVSLCCFLYLQPWYRLVSMERTVSTQCSN